MSQEKLAAAINLTFQQVQKYERGSNRVSASKLYEIASALGVPLLELFEGLPPTTADRGPVTPNRQLQMVRKLTETRDGETIAALFPGIRSARLRRVVADLVRAIAAEE